MFNLDVRDIQDIFDIYPISSDAQKFIFNLIKSTTTPTTIRIICETVQDEIREMYSIHIVRSYLKRYWYIISKRLDRDLPNTPIQRSKLIKKLFCSELLKMLYNQLSIISVDKWSFTREVKTKYSLLLVGKKLNFHHWFL